MDQTQNNDYLLQVQKLMSSDVASTQWSHNMDLLVIVTVDNLLQLYRINFKAQKVFQVEEDKPITAVCFSPDSQFIAYGMNDGETKVLKTENGETLLSVNDPISEEVKAFSFVEFGKYPLAKIFPFKQSPIMEKLILQISPHKNCNKGSIVKLNYFNELTDDDTFTLLVSSTQKHTCLHLNGFIPIGQLSYDLLATKHFPPTSSEYTIHHSHFNPHTHKLQSVLIQQAPHSYIINLVQFDTSILKEMQSDIIKFSCLIGYVSEIIAFVEQAYPAAEVFLRDILRQYNSKINLIDDPDQEGVSPGVELFKYLNCGITSPALINFLTKEVYDTKLLQKLDETLNAIFNSLHDLLLESVQNSLERAYLLVQELKALSQLEKYKVFGVKSSDLKRIQEDIEKLYTMGEILLVESTEAKFDIRNLLVWLNKATIKTASDPNVEIENTKSYLSRYTVDFTRLHAFLQTEDSFRLQNLTSFFSKGNETHTMRIPQCEFRLLNRLNNPDPKLSAAYIEQTRKIESLLDLDDIVLPSAQKMSLELSYKSLRLELKQLKDEWKQLRVKPVIEISKNIEQRYELIKIGEVPASEVVSFDVKSLLKKKEQTGQEELLLYWIHHSPRSGDQVMEYNTSTLTTRRISLPSSLQALSLSVGIDIILLLQHTSTMHEEKSIVQVMNEQWNGEELQTGKRIDKLSGEILINAGLRGLNLMVVNKNKLVVFD